MLELQRETFEAFDLSGLPSRSCRRWALESSSALGVCNPLGWAGGSLAPSVQDSPGQGGGQVLWVTAPVAAQPWGWLQPQQ